jgi:uncharacterized protein YkwD
VATLRARRRAVFLAAAAVVSAGLAIVNAPPATSDVAVDQRMLDLVNKERLAQGLKPVVADATLSAVADSAPNTVCGFKVEGRAKDMGVRNYFSHTIKDCGPLSVLGVLNSLVNAVLSGPAENIAWMNGTTDPTVAADNLHSQLMADPAHRANILNPAHTKVGIGSWRSAPGQTWSGAGFPLVNVFIGVQIFSGGPVDAAVAPPGGGRYHPLTPSRLADTRTAGGPVGPGGVTTVQVSGRAGVPASGVSAVVVNLTATEPTAPGYLTVFPAGQPVPVAANLTFAPGQTVANLVVTTLGSGGQLSIRNAAGSVHVVVDVAGWYDTGTATSGGRFHPTPAQRILDTRAGTGNPAAPIGPGASVVLQASGRGGLPSTGVSAVVLNLTATQPTAPGYVTVFPTGEPAPVAVNLTFGAGQTVSNVVVAKLGQGGRVSIYNAAGTTHLVADVAGWYDDGSDPSGTRFHPISQSRVLDTRTGIGAPAGPAGQGATLAVQVAGQAAVPSTGVSAVVLTVTAVDPTAAGWLTVFPAGEPLPLAANLTFAPGQTVPNLVVVKVGAGGKVAINNALGSTHVVADVAGWYDAGG